MEKLSILVYLYDAEGIQSSVNLESDDRTRGARNTLAKIIQGCVFPFFENGYEECESESDFPYCARFNLSDEIELSIDVIRKPDPFKRIDFLRGNNKCGWYVSRISVNNFEFSEYQDALDFVNYLAQNRGSFSDDLDIENFKYYEKANFESCKKHYPQQFN